MSLCCHPLPPTEDATDIKKGMKAMEEKNTVYMQQILDLEEELRKMSSVKVQLKTYKQRVRTYVCVYLHVYVCVFVAFISVVHLCTLMCIHM